MAESNEERIHEINISQEMRNSFMDYAMSVIVSRALPDVRDGTSPHFVCDERTGHDPGQTV